MVRERAAAQMRCGAGHGVWRPAPRLSMYGPKKLYKWSCRAWRVASGAEAVSPAYSITASAPRT